MYLFNVIHLFRKRNPIFFSIEKVFSIVGVELTKIGFHISTIELPANQGLKSLLTNLLFVKKIKKNKIIHITGDVHYVAMILSPSRTILTIHDVGFLGNNTGFKKKILKKIWIDLPLNRLKYITVISKATKNELVSINSKWEKKIEVIHNPVNSIFKYHHKQFNSDCPRILHIGITPNKNLLRTIEALQNINCVIVFIGIIPQDIKEVLVANNVNFEEKYNLTEAELVTEYNNCDIVSFCSLLEGFGLPIVEAQAVGRIVVTSNIEPMMSVAGTGAIFANPYNISEMRDAFISAIKNKELREGKITKGLENVKQYDAKIIANQYAALYKKIENKNLK